MLATTKQPGSEQQSPIVGDAAQLQKTAKTPSLEPEYPNSPLLGSSPPALSPSIPASPSKADQGSVPPNNRNDDLDFKTSIWDDVFGGTVKPDKNPSSFQNFEQQVNACIRTLNQDPKKGVLEQIQPLDLERMASIKSAEWDRKDRIEIQDAKGCFTYNPYRRLLATWDKDTIWIYQFDRSTQGGFKCIQTKSAFQGELLFHHSVTFSKDGSTIFVVTDQTINCFTAKSDGEKSSHPTKSEEPYFWRPEKSEIKRDKFIIVDKFFYESLELPGNDD